MKTRDGKSQIRKSEKRRKRKIKDALRKSEESRSKKRRSEKEDTGAQKKVGKSRYTAFFPMICGSGGSKSRLPKATGAKPTGQMRDEKLHAVAARSTCPRVRSTEHFWTFRCCFVWQVQGILTSSRNEQNVTVW